VTDEEIARYGAQRPEPEPEAEPKGAQPGQVSGGELPLLERDQVGTDVAEIRERADAIEEAVNWIPDREAERAGELEAAGENEPVIHEAQAEPELEPSWYQDEAAADHETRASKPEPAAQIEDIEPELEI
jgi:hypothetical protein